MEFVDIAKKRKKKRDEADIPNELSEKKGKKIIKKLKRKKIQKK